MEVEMRQKEMAAAIRELATAGISPKALIERQDNVIRATKKEVARAAFMSVMHSRPSRGRHCRLH
jgi:CTP synthase (UTP-ammonia lyase)